MSEQSDRDILIEVRTDVKALVRDMTDPGGRVPRLEATVEEHSKEIDSATGGVKAIAWLVGLLVVLVAGLGAVVLAQALQHKP